MQDVSRFQPGLLTINEDELTGRLQHLMSHAQLTRSQATALVRRHPAALLQTAERMQARLEKLGEVLGLPPQVIIYMI